MAPPRIEAKPYSGHRRAWRGWSAALSARSLALVCALMLAQGARAEETSELATRLTNTFAAIEHALAASPRPGMIVGITDRAKTQAVLVHGYSDLNARKPLTPDSRFALGSISKSFTAIALMQLADQGRFDPQRPIHDYLPPFFVHSRYPPITGRHLLSMTSGLPNYLADVASSRFAIIKLQEFTPTYAPGEHWWYSNTGFQILGYVLENIDRAPYRTIIQRRIFDALGMNDSAAAIDDSQRTRLAVSYIQWPYDQAYVEAPWFEYAAADGSILSTAPDMCAYLRLILNHGNGPSGRVLSEKSFAELTTPVLDDYAYGLMVRQENGDTVIAHAGQIAGFENYVEAHMKQGFGIVFLTNGGLDTALQRWVTAAVGAAYRGESLPVAPVSDDDARLHDPTAYSGTYERIPRQRGMAATKLNFTASNDGLLLNQSGVLTALEPMGVDTFRVATPSADSSAYFFSRAGASKSGRVVAVSHGYDWFVTSQYDGPISAAPALYFAYTGHYQNHGPEGPDVRVFVENGRLIMTLGGIYDSPGSVRQHLEPIGDGVFRVGDRPHSPERAHFDSITDGHALRLMLSDVPLYRMETP